jgi:hypothetical protein
VGFWSTVCSDYKRTITSISNRQAEVAADTVADEAERRAVSIHSVITICSITPQKDEAMQVNC